MNQAKRWLVQTYKYPPSHKLLMGVNTMEENRYAVVTGANKGIGFEICKQLAREGITVVLTARDEKRGRAAAEELTSQCSDDQVLFHKLDVADPASITALADFIKTRFGKLDILVNNAGVSGAKLDLDSFAKASQLSGGWPSGELNWKELAIQTYDSAVECVQINYYGAKRMVETFAPLLRLSSSPRIVNISSSLGLLEKVTNKWARGVLGDGEGLTEEKVERVLDEFVRDLKEGMLEAKGWSPHAYSHSKACMNAYTRILANKYPRFRVNSVCPGFVKTDMNCNTGVLSAAQGAESAVRLALLPDDGPSGLFFNQKQVSSF